jgi:hypothetical protein
MAKKISVEKFLEKIKDVSLEQTEELLDKIRLQATEKRLAEIKKYEDQIAKLKTPAK